MSFNRFMSKKTIPEAHIETFEKAKKQELENLRALVVANTPPLVQDAIMDGVIKIIHNVLADNVSLRADALAMLKMVNDIGDILNDEPFEEEQSDG